MANDQPEPDGQRKLTVEDLERFLEDASDPEFAQRLADDVPLRDQDQISAAQADLAKIAQDTTTGTPAPGVDGPPWFRRAALQAYVDIVNGDASTCRHLARRVGAQPMFANAGTPGLIVCRECQYRLHDAYVCECKRPAVTGVRARLGTFAYHAAACQECAVHRPALT
ncbi:hypothetical protein BH10ACT9_BH10ACT9_36510 [soil metagenome]